MDIIYFGHSSFKLTNKNTSLVIDPFGDEIGLKFPKTQADIVLVSHDHYDHNKVDNVEGVEHVFDGPGEYEVKGVSVIGIPAFHDKTKGADRGKNTVFVIEMDGLRIAHLGDLGHKLSEKQLEQMGDINILMVPVGGHFTLDHEDAVSLSQSIEPNIIIPMHYKVTGLDSKIADHIATEEQFVNDIAAKVEKTSKLTVKDASALSEEQLVVLLH